MPWGRLDDQANSNAKLLALSDAAWRMWGCGLIYCQANLTDGFIPEHAVHAFGVRAKNKAIVIDELCSILVPGKQVMWERVAGGYQIHDYLDWNNSRKEVMEDRARSRDRVDNWRERRKNGVGNGVTNEESNERSTTTTTSTTTKEDPTAVLVFPTRGRPSRWVLTQSQVDEWTPLYPGLDVVGCARRALAWAKANGPKTSRGMPAFLVSWFNREVNSGRARTNGAESRRSRGNTPVQPDKYAGLTEGADE